MAVTPRAFGNGEAPLVGGPTEGGESRPCPIPEKYRSVATSGLSAEVQAGGNQSFDFDLVP